MQVTETAAAGLKREYRVVVPATDFEAQVKERLDDIKGRVQLRGFRPGKVPVAHLKRLYGKSAMAEVIEAAVREANTKIVSDHGFKLATEPKVVLPTEEGAVEGVIEGKSDLAYTVEMEIVPPITLADFKTFKLERLTAPVTDDEIDQALKTIAEQNRPFAAKSRRGGKRRSRHRIVSGHHERRNLRGRLRRRTCRSCSASGQFIPGFEDHLIGIKTGESRTFDVKFPEGLSGASRRRQRRHFCGDGEDGGGARRSHAWTTPSPRRLGLESLAKLRDALRERIEREHAAATRQKVKRALLDQLDAHHKFEPPPTLVEEEFNNVWQAIENDLKQQGRSFADEGTTEEKAREDYRGIAERRVRLGLVLARNRREEQYQGDRRAVEPKRSSPRPECARPGAAGVGLLPQQSRCARRAARADIRGQGRRFPARACRRHRQAGFAGRIVQGRRGVRPR